MEQGAPKRDLVSTLARVLGAGLALVLLGSALWHTVPLISSVGQTASTWLGDQTGAPQGYLGRLTPDDTDCWVFDYGYKGYPGWGANGPDGTPCAVQRGAPYSDYDMSTGKTITNPIAEPLYAMDYTQGINVQGNGLQDAIWFFYGGALSVSRADESTAFDSTVYRANAWIQDKIAPPNPTASGGKLSCNWAVGTVWPGPNKANYFGFDPPYFTDVKNVLTSDKNEAKCWYMKQGETPPLGGLQPWTLGQTAFVISEYAPSLKVKKLGFVNASGRCTDYQLPRDADPDDYQAGDTISYYDTRVTGNFVRAKYFQTPDGKDECWQIRANPEPAKVQNRPQQTEGDILEVPPGTDLMLQWSCQPSRKVQHGICDGFHNGNCNDTSGGYYDLRSIFNATVGSTNAPTAFSTGGSIANKKRVTAPPDGGVYSYSVTCRGAAPDATLTVKVRVKAECKDPTAAEIVPGGFKLTAGQARRETVGTITFCAWNQTANTTYFVPTKTVAEFNAFRDAVRSGDLGDNIVEN